MTEILYVTLLSLWNINSILSPDTKKYKTSLQFMDHETSLHGNEYNSVKYSKTLCILDRSETMDVGL